MSVLKQEFVFAERRSTVAPLTIVWLIVLGALALLPRVLGLSDFLTADEIHHWIDRVERFSAAIAGRDWASTNQTGHPGVTTMWLGSLGLYAERLAVAQGWAQLGSVVDHLAWLRLPSAIVQSLAVVLGYAWLRRIVRQPTAMIAALLWATSPYLIAHGRVLHLDGLLTSFLTLSLLAILVACRSEQPRRWIVAAGVCYGLALLTKGPALIALPVIGLLLFWLLPTSNLIQRLRGSIGWYALWLATALIVVLLLWPALWSTPGAALERYLGEIIWNGGRPNGDGQFFLGQAIGDPGPLFYVVANAFRLTPVALLGLALLPFALWRHRSDRDMLLALGAFVLFWTLIMTLGPKKFDRYQLPTWPALLILSAAGIDWALSTLWSAPHASSVRRAAAGLAGALLLVASAQPLFGYHPYYLSYYNPLLGGGAAAQRNLLIGWGEGMDQVGAYLRSRPDIQYGPVLTALPQTLAPFVPVPVKDVTTFGDAPANYAVVYLESVQRAADPPLYAKLQQTLPLKRITIHGIDYAEIYQLPKPFAQPVDAQFGEAIRVRGVTVDQAPGQLIVTPSWDVRSKLDADYLLFLHIFNAEGQRVAQIDVAPNGGGPATSAWQPGEQLAVPLPVPFPAELPAGSYRVVLGLYDPAAQTRLPLTVGTAAPVELDGEHALLLTTVEVASR
ncbi:MAG TPA: glycosyltransferase family 39 protein [Herpetosiphonaceae bacterium]